MRSGSIPVDDPPGGFDLQTTGDAFRDCFGRYAGYAQTPLFDATRE